MQKTHQYRVGYSAKVIIERGALFKLQDLINQDKKLSRAPKYLFIVDRNFNLHHQDLLNKVLTNLKQEYAVMLVDVGPKLKSLAGVESLYKNLNEHNVKRDSVIIVVGGGVLCDTVGFTSATYMRGICTINIPTTMMSCADPVMGKVAVDHLSQKNLVGSWFFPYLTLVDPSLIKKDMPRYFNTGISEIIKSALISDKNTFNKLEKDIKILMKGDEEIIKKYIEMSIKIKIKCVKGDEQDVYGRHSKLSLGHNLADVLESLAPPTTITHGEAVALGMIFAASVNNIIEHTKLSEELLNKTIQLIREAGLPIQIPFLIEKEQIVEGLLRSKKSCNNAIVLVLAKDYGRIETKEVDPAVINMASETVLKR